MSGLAPSGTLSHWFRENFARDLSPESAVVTLAAEAAQSPPGARVLVVLPYFSGELLSDSSDFEIAVEMYRTQPATADLDPEGAIQAWIFQQFLVLLVLAPIAASMSVAAYSVIGEKQARTLEPLLATPLTTFELLAAKVLGSLVPALGLTAAAFAAYVGAVALFAQPGVFAMLLLPQPLAIVFLLMPRWHQQTRLFILPQLITMHFGFLIFLSVGWFPLVSIAGLTLFVRDCQKTP